MKKLLIAGIAIILFLIIIILIMSLRTGCFGGSSIDNIEIRPSSDCLKITSNNCNGGVLEINNKCGSDLELGSLKVPAGSYESADVRAKEGDHYILMASAGNYADYSPEKDEKVTVKGKLGDNDLLLSFIKTGRNHRLNCAKEKPEYQGYCYMRLAGAQNDIALCENVPEKMETVALPSSIFNEVVMSNKAANSIYDSSGGLNARKLCYIYVAARANDDTICTEYLIDEDTENCLETLKELKR